MSKYNSHSLMLNDDEESKLQSVIKFHTIGIKKIFMKMVNNLYNDIPSENSSELIGDGINKSGIMLNINKSSTINNESSTINEEE